MKIESGPDVLVIDNRPLVVTVGLALVALVLAAIGLGLLSEGAVAGGLGVIVGGGLFLLPFFAAFVRRNQLILDRRAGTLTHRRKTLRSYTEVQHDLVHLAAAEVETSHGSETATHRMVYVLDGGPDAGRHPFTTAYTSGRGARRAADAVNAWLRQYGPRG